MILSGLVVCARDQNALQFVIDGEHPRPHVEINTHAPFNVVDGLTIEAWVRLKEYPEGQFPPKWQAIVTKGEAWGLTRYSNTNRIAFRTTVGGATHVLAGTETKKLVSGKWHHVAAVWDGSTKFLYIDGVLDVSEAWDGPPDGNTFHVMIGANEQFPARAYAGDIDDVRVWSTARTAAEIATTMRRRLLGSEDGLLGYWRFESVADGADGVPDASANGHHGILHDIDAGAALADDGVLMGAPSPGEYALRFDGTDDAGANTEQYVKLRNKTLFDFTAAMTVECDVYIDVAPSSQAALVSKGGNAWHLDLNADRTVNFSGAGLSTNVTSATALPTGEWRHVAATWDGSSLLLLIDGVIDAWQQNVSGPMGTDGSKLVLFGAQPPDGDPTHSFKGRLDNVRLWNTARTPQQITENMGRAFGGHGPGLVGAWDFNESGGAAVADGRILIEPAADTLDFAGASGAATVTEDGFSVTVDPGSLVVETNTGSDTLRADTTGALITLTRSDTHAFRLLSMDVANATGDAAPGTQITFEGTLADGWGTVEQTVVLGAGLDLTAVAFTAFSNVTAVSWIQEGSGHQFDNIVVHDVTGLDVDQLKSDGGLVNIPDSQRVAGAKTLASPLPANYALYFDGVDDYLQVTHAAPLDLGAFTFEAWVKPDASSGNEFRTIMRKGDLGYGLAIDAGGHLRYFVGDGSVSSAVSSTGTVADGEWQHVAVSVSPDTNTILFYINGEPAGEIEDNDVLTNTDHLVLGRQGLNTDAGYFHGDMTEIRLWDHALQPDVIAGFANRRLPTVVSGLIACWDCNEGAGATTADGTDNDLDATLASEGGAGLPMWSYGPTAPFRTGMYALYFDGEDDYLRSAHDARFNLTSALTIEAWVQPEENDTEDGLRTIVMKGDNNASTTGYGLALDAAGHLCFWIDANTANVLKSTGTVANGAWQHVAVSVTGGSSASFFINGELAGIVTTTTAVLNNNTEDLFIGRQGIADPDARNHYQGLMDEVRIWNVARTGAEIASAALRQLPGSETGLVGYWQLNDYADYEALSDEDKTAANALRAEDETAALIATLVNMEVNAWQSGLYTLEWDGPFWEVEPVPTGMNLAADPTTRGLWIGTVSLGWVTELATARSGYAGTMSETADVASFTALFHVDDNGRVRLLKDVVLMRRVEDETGTVAEEDVADDALLDIALVTDPTLIPQFQGLVVRRGKLVGQRYGTVGYDFEGNEHVLMGGLGPGRALRGTLTLSRTHPTNPFRHKYHPDHRNTSDINPAYGREITRELSIVFDESYGGETERGGYGVDRIRGTYRETVRGLVKFPIETRGVITLERVCDVGKLNE